MCPATDGQKQKRSEVNVPLTCKLHGAGDGKSKDLLHKSLFRCGPSALACCAGKCSRIFSASHPGGFDPRHPTRLRKRLWSQKGSKPLANLMERATGIEPAWSAWEAEILPLNHARIGKSLYRYHSTSHRSFQRNPMSLSLNGSAQEAHIPRSDPNARVRYITSIEIKGVS